jgi:hypothetical protein
MISGEGRSDEGENKRKRNNGEQQEDEEDEVVSGNLYQSFLKPLEI